MPLPEIDFNLATDDTIIDLLMANGCVLLRHFVDGDRVASTRRHVEELYSQIAAVHVYARDLRARGLPMFHEGLFNARHQVFLAALFGKHGATCSEETIARSIDPALKEVDARWLKPLNPHIDAFSHAPEFTANFWMPLQECGPTVPRLAVVPASFAEILEFTGYDAAREPSPSGTARRFLPQFAPRMRALFAGEPETLVWFRDHFGARIWAPTYRPGDAMLLTNWTIHLTHATEDMETRRTNLELRFSGTASLQDIRTAHTPATGRSA